MSRRVFLDGLFQLFETGGVLRNEVASRKDAFGRGGVSSFDEYQRSEATPLPRIVILLDGYGGFTSAYERVNRGETPFGPFFAPTVLGAVKPAMRIAREEVFGPVISLIEFETFEEAIEIANSIDYGLSTALYTKDVNRAFTAMRDLEAGITYINAPTIGAEVHLPFGGVKQTGNGHREGLGEKAL